MIRHLRLRQWRSYDSLDLDLGPGTTFVVAPNGVGKTSLVLGLAWAVFGSHVDLDARSCIRAGAEGAEAWVTLLLPDGRELVIHRQVSLRGRPKASGRLDGEDISESAVAQVLERSFGVDLGVATRLSMMLGGGQLASEKALDLKSHLYTAFGVADLLRAAEVAEAVAKEAEKQRSALRATNRQRLADRASVEAQVSETEALLAQHNDRRVELLAEARAAEAQKGIVAQLKAYAEQQAQYERALTQLLDRAKELLAPEVNASDLRTVVQSGKAQAEEDADAAAEGYAEAKGAAAAASEAISTLSGEEARCPTCLRPIGADEISIARAEHQHRLALAGQAAEEHNRAHRERRARAASLAELLTRIDSLQIPAPPEGAVGAVNVEEVETNHAAALSALETHNQQIGTLQAQLRQLQSLVEADEKVMHAERLLHLAYRREAITSAAAVAFRQAVTKVTDELIEPVAEEVRWRWKRLFANDGLKLRSDGSIVRAEAGQELGWEVFSDGERIWARIVTHLLVISSSTKLPFAWFDEPLEHLDPQLRHAVAASLATACEGGSPAQVLVTTYENTIARQLAEDTPHASLINLRASRRHAHPGPARDSADVSVPPDRARQVS